MMALDDVEKCKCLNATSKLVSDFPLLNDILPVDYEYTVCSYAENDKGNYTSRFRINISSKDEALKWIEEFKHSSNSNYNKERTFKDNTLRNVYKVIMHCHHNTRPKSWTKAPHKKYTKCPMRFILNVKQTALSRKYQSKDIHLKDFPTHVIIYFNHNHSSDSAEALKFCLPSSEVKEAFLKHFLSGLTPAKAYELYTSELQDIYKDKYYVANAERAICPDIKWVYYLYYHIFKKEYGHSSGNDMLSSSESFISKYNTEHNGEFIESSQLESKDSSLLPENNEPVLLSSPASSPEMDERDFSANSDESTEEMKDDEDCNRNKTELLSKLDSIFNEIKSKTENNDTIYTAAKKFIKNFENIKTEAALETALATFGKYSDFDVKRRIKRPISAKSIGVQPTAISRCKVPCGRRKCIQSGRPPKGTFTPEHEYCIEMQKSTLLSKKQKISAPYITYCTNQSISLVKMH